MTVSACSRKCYNLFQNMEEMLASLCISSLSSVLPSILLSISLSSIVYDTYTVSIMSRHHSNVLFINISSFVPHNRHILTVCFVSQLRRSFLHQAYESPQVDPEDLESQSNQKLKLTKRNLTQNKSRSPSSLTYSLTYLVSGSFKITP